MQKSYSGAKAESLEGLTDNKPKQKFQHIGKQKQIIIGLYCRYRYQLKSSHILHPSLIPQPSVLEKKTLFKSKVKLNYGCGDIPPYLLTPPQAYFEVCSYPLCRWSPINAACNLSVNSAKTQEVLILLVLIRLDDPCCSLWYQNNTTRGTCNLRTSLAIEQRH